MGSHLDEKEKARKFELMVMPHLDSAYNLARWLTRDEANAEDLVQMAYLRAFKFFDGFRGDDARAWLLTIVRNAYFTSLRDNQHETGHVSFDEEMHVSLDEQMGLAANDPEQVLVARDTQRMVNQALEKMPSVFREVIVLKEINELSYKEIADITDVPLGTVMSRLARGRKMLGDYLKKAVGG